MRGINLALTPFQVLMVAMLAFITIVFLLYAKGGIESLIDQVDLFISQIIGA